MILNDEFVGCDADVKGVDFGPPGSLRLSLLDPTKVGQDLERKEEGGRDRKRKKAKRDEQKEIDKYSTYFETWTPAFELHLPV